MKSKKIVTIIALCVMMLSMGCSNNDEKATKVNIAYFPNITHAQALVMKDFGTLEDKLDGTAVNWQSFNAGPAEIEALFAGQVDIGYIGPVPAITGYMQSSGDLRIIAGASNGGAVLIARNDAGIKTTSDLKGKTIAIPQIGNTQHLSLLTILSENNLAPVTDGGDVTIVASTNADVVNLMDQKNIDVAFVPEPWGSILELNRSGEVVLEYDEVASSGIPSTAVVIVRKDFLEQHPDIVETFIEAHRESTDFINENMEAAKEIVNKQIELTTQNTIDSEVLNKAFNRLEVTYKIPKESIMEFAQVSLEEDIISKMPDSDLIDVSFLE